MANQSFIFTDSKIRSLKPGDKQYHVWHADGLKGRGSLGVRVNKSGQKVFVYRYFVRGKAKIVSLGAYPSISLFEANQLKIDAAKKYIDGLSVDDDSQFAQIMQNKTKKELGTVSDLFDGYVQDLRARKRRTADDVKAKFKYLTDNSGLYGLSGDVLAQDVTHEHIKILLSKYVKRGAKTEGNKVRSLLHAAFNWGLRSDNDPAFIDVKRLRFELKSNPVTIVPQQRGASRALDRYLSWKELFVLINETQKPAKELRMSYTLSRLIALCIFSCGQRPIELLRLKRSNIDFDRRIIDMTPEMTKTEKHHVFYLCDSALKIITELVERTEADDYLFSSKTEEHYSTQAAGKALARYIKRSGFAHFTLRDIRRTFKTLAAELKVSSELRDRVQCHAIKGVSDKHYDRYMYLTEKKEVTELWERSLLALTA
ncbi:tyrosine-type recombinase/integrase [Testudinibacter sp. P80/BLE/0925]